MKQSLVCTAVALCNLLGVSCSQSSNSKASDSLSKLHRAANAVDISKIKLNGQADIAVLYNRDTQAQRQALLDWFKTSQATVKFESVKFGYLDAQLPAAQISTLLEQADKLNLSESATKIEFENVVIGSSEVEDSAPQNKILASPLLNSEMLGPVHSAGYGSKIEDFKENVASEFGISKDDIQGQGMKIGIYDPGVFLARTDVFQDRIDDFIIGSESVWVDANDKLDQSDGSLIRGLEDLQGDSKIAQTMRWIHFDKSLIKVNLNGSGKNTEGFDVVLYKKDDHLECRFRPYKQSVFGPAFLDFGMAR